MTSHPLDKNEVLRVIRRAKSSHIRWRTFAQAMVTGLPVEEEQAPVRHTECQFGKWYYGQGKALLGHIDIFQDIETTHELLHHIYAQIFSLVQERKLSEAKALYEELIGVSRTLLEQIDLLEEEVRSL